MSDFLINFVDDEHEDEHLLHANKKQDWLIAIIDDEQSVHDATKLALSKTKILDRNLKFISAFSGEEGFSLLKDNPDCSVVLLDVVMESSDAGLILAERIRHELKRDNLQIILRTGQPGYAPEEDIISKYEINDYKTKNELTRDKLFTSLATALRSFSHLNALEQSKIGLKNVINASASLMKERSVHEFAGGVLQQINALFNLSAQGIFCVSQKPLHGPHEFDVNKSNSFLVVATTDQYDFLYGKNIQDVTAGDASKVAQQALANKEHVLRDNLTALYLTTPSQWQGVVVIEGGLDHSGIDEELLKISV